MTCVKAIEHRQGREASAAGAFGGECSCARGGIASLTWRFGLLVQEDAGAGLAGTSLLFASVRACAVRHVR